MPMYYTPQMEALFDKLASNKFFGIQGNAIHPFSLGNQSTALALGVPMNVHGLINDDKVGFQLGGAAAGGLGGAALTALGHSNPASIATLALLGGAAGAGIDSWRARKAQNQREKQLQDMLQAQGIDPSQYQNY